MCFEVGGGGVVGITQTCGANPTTGFKGSRGPEGVFSPILWSYEEGTGCMFQL